MTSPALLAAAALLLRLRRRIAARRRGAAGRLARPVPAGATAALRRRLLGLSPSCSG